MKVEFKCPKCHGRKLECVMDGIHFCEVTEIDDGFDFEYGEYQSDAMVDRWQCLMCGYVIQDDNEENIINNEEVVEWCQQNCKEVTK